MKFLCLHGRGTNSKIFEMQTNAIRYELADHHDYEFVEGVVPWDKDPDLEKLLSSNDETFAFFDEHNPVTALDAIDHLATFVDAEGPYDGVIAYSQAVGVVATWMAAQAQQGKQPFKCAIFFSGASPMVDYEALTEGRVAPLDPLAVNGALSFIDVPTVHVWGANDPWRAVAEKVSQGCKADVRSVFVHPGAHEVPGSGAKESVTKAVNLIRRAVLQVQAAA